MKRIHLIIALIFAFRTPKLLLTKSMTNAAWLSFVHSTEESTLLTKLPINTGSYYQLLFQACIGLQPTSRSCSYGLGLSEMKKGHLSQGLAHWQDGGVSNELMTDVGTVALSHGKLAFAQSWFQLLCATSPEDGDLWYLLANAYLVDERFPHAENALLRAASSQTLTLTGKSDLYFALAQMYRNSQKADLGLSLRMYQYAVDSNDFHIPWQKVQSWYEMGEILGMQGQWEKSYKALHEAVQLDRTHYWATLRLGIATAKSGRDWMTAVDLIETSLDIWPSNDPQRKWAYLHMAEILAEHNREMAAKAAYEQVLLLDPRNELALGKLRNE